VFAQTWQGKHEGVFKLTVNVRLNLVEVFILTAFGKFCAEDFLPVWPPFDFVHALPGNQRSRTCHGLMIARRCVVQVLVIEIERLVIVVNRGQIRVGKDIRQHAKPPADAWLNFAIGTA